MPVEPLAGTLPPVEASAPPKTRRAARPAGRIRKGGHNADRVRLLAGLVLLSLLLGGALILGKQMIGPLATLFESGKKAPTYGAALVNTLSATYTHPGTSDTEEALSTETSTVTPTIAPSPPPTPPATETATSLIAPTVTVTAPPTARPVTPKPLSPTDTPTWAMGTPTPTPVNAAQYVLNYGDTLFTIASQFHVVMNELMGVNSLQCNSLLPVAKEIVIPSSYWITLPKYTPISMNLASRLEIASHPGLHDRCDRDQILARWRSDGRGLGEFRLPVAGERLETTGQAQGAYRESEQPGFLARQPDDCDRRR